MTALSQEAKPVLIFLAHRIPYPPNKGDKIRSFNELAFLSQHFSIELFCPYDRREDADHMQTLLQYCQSVHAFYLNRWLRLPSLLLAFLTGQSLSVALFRIPGLAKRVTAALKKHPKAPVLVFSGQMAAYLPESDLNRAVVDFCDVDSYKWQHYADSHTGLKSWFYRREAKNLLAFESHVSQQSRAALFITPAECDLYRSLGGKGPIQAMPNGVDTAFFHPRGGQEIPGRILFTGAMDYFPNIEGVEWFAKEVFPSLRARHPGIRFIIAGSNPTPRVKALADAANIEVTGFVPDMRDEQAKAEIVIVPLRIARGMQNKVLEAMACGKAVVATSRSLGGIDAVDGRELRIADTAETFAAVLDDLLTHPATRTALSQAGRDYVVRLFSWESQLTQVLLPPLQR
jgi:polysaccharide biosynthesis protein PslH